MNIKEEKLTQEEIDMIFCAVNKLRRAMGRELNEREIKKLICGAHNIAKH